MVSLVLPIQWSLITFTLLGTSSAQVVWQPIVSPCTGGVSIPNSNRTAVAPCQGVEGEECHYECDSGYLPVGRHVCQTYSVSGKTIIDNAFFGGRCDKLCASVPCQFEYRQTNNHEYCKFGSDVRTGADCRAAAIKFGLTFEREWNGTGAHKHCYHDNARNKVFFNTASPMQSAMTSPSLTYSSLCLAKVPVRMNVTENGEACLRTICLEPEAALFQLAKGGYELFQRGRNPKTGIYLDHVDVKLPAEEQFFGDASIDSTAVGMAVECVAANLGIVSMQEAQEKVLTTMRALTGRIPGFKVPRNPQGFLPQFIHSDSGVPYGNNSFATDSTGIFGVGQLFARTCFENSDPTSPTVQEIISLSDELHAAVQYDLLLCDQGTVTSDGIYIPYLMDNGTGCSDVISYMPDGYYNYNEMIWIAYLAFHQACGKQPPGQCSNKPIERMWAAWQGRRNHLWYYYGGRGVLTIWPSFLLQLPFYLVHAFNSDATYTELFKIQWQAEWDYYTSRAFNAGEDGRYGLGAGPTMEWCAGTTYQADMISNQSDGNNQHCRMYSPYAVAGYLPAAPSVIQGHLLALLSSGDAVYPLVDSDLFVLWRKSLIDPSWSQPDWGITLVDFASEFFGLSSLWLGADFFKRSSKFWSDEADRTTPSEHVLV